MGEQTDALPGYCPTCGVYGQDECPTTTGRDHPARRHYAMGWAAASRLVRATLPAEQQDTDTTGRGAGQ